jgi:hypothetical protein
MNRKTGALAALLCLVSIGPANAHDGGFGHSRRTIFVTAEPKQFIIEYRISMNRDEALLELAQVDRNHDGKIADDEKNDYFTARGKALGEHLQLRTPDNTRVPLRFVGYELKHPLCQVYRFAVETTATELLLDDQNFPYKPGHIRIVAGIGVKVELAKPTDLNHAERVYLKITRLPELPK